ARGETLAGAGTRAPLRSARTCESRGGGEARRSQSARLRGRGVQRMRQLHFGAQRHVLEVRHVRLDDGVFVTLDLKRRPAGRPFFLPRSIAHVKIALTAVEPAGAHAAVLKSAP